VDITGCDTLASINLSYSDGLDETDVDGILAEVESWGTSSGALNLVSTEAPSSAGQADVAALSARGWTVQTDTVSSGGVNFDNFERPDVTGIANVGNGWYAWNSATANVVSGTLVRPDAGAYRQILNPGASLPADYSVTASIPHATLGPGLG
jgi:hypothetical protein